MHTPGQYTERVCNRIEPQTGKRKKRKDETALQKGGLQGQIEAETEGRAANKQMLHYTVGQSDGETHCANDKMANCANKGNIDGN